MNARSILLLCLALPATAQTTATLIGIVKDPRGYAIPAASIIVENAVTRYRSEISTQEDGTFTLSNIPFHSYEITVTKTGFSVWREAASLRSNIPVQLEITLQLAGAAESITVSERPELLVDPEETGTHIQMNQTDIEKMALQVANKGLESVLVSFPGFAQNANGAIHPRGAHNQMTFVIDGMPITDQLTGAFANSVDPNIVQTVELFTGNVPAEYGSKVSAVANVTTRSGLGSGRSFSGSLMLNAAGFDTFSQVTSLSGERGKFGYSATINTMKSNRYLDSVSLDNLHNGGNSQRGFFRLDFQPGGRDVLRLNGMAGRSSFQLANLRSQHAAGMDQRQQLRDASGSFTWVRTVDARTTFDTTTSYRTTVAQLFPSPADTPVTASQARHLSTFTTGGRLNMVRGIHTLRMGADIQRFPVSENFFFGVTDPGFNDPQSGGYNPNLAPHDLSRGGTPFLFSEKRTGGFYSGFLQDSIRAGRWQITLGLRYDNYRFLVEGQQYQPRIGVSYFLKETNTVFRASYNRLYQTAPNENLLLSASPEAYAIAPPAVRETFGEQVARMQPEKQDFFEAGLQQGIGRRLSANVSYYHKQSRDQQDNNNFLDTGVIFPITLSQIRVNGVEGRLNLTPARGFSGSLSVTHSRAVTTPPFTGGLYIGNEAVDALSAGPFLIDHDQPLSVHGILTYSGRRGFYATWSTRYDSGLVANPSDPAEVAADPDYSDLLPYVNLGANPARVTPRTITDIVAGYERRRNERKAWDISLQISNLTNATALYNFQSVFVGTRVVQPRTAGVRLRLYF
jgi:outer membrane cobalamin receptor